MTVARTWSVALTGLVGRMIEVEADLSKQTPEFRIIGLADKALGEAVQRVHNACDNSGLALPRRRLTVNLSPAWMPKHGAGFDVAIAIASLATEGLMDVASVARTVHLGELGLDGRLRPVPGVLPAVLAASKAGYTQVVVPEANRAEAEFVDDMRVVGAATLAEVARFHGAEVDVPESVPPAAPPRDASPVPLASGELLDLSDVIGQPEAVDALLVAAAGGHHLMMSGPPGAGKTMLARRLPGILPPLDREAALSVASVRSLAGETVTTLSHVPPFEAPHHTASVASLVGGGSRGIRPGAIARATEGILFLDEVGEFPASALDALRQPLEQGSITIHRAGQTAEFPAQVQLVLATNPCPCGDYGVRGGTCTCAPSAIRRYIGKLSGPLLDRVDIELAMTRVSVAHATGSTITTAQARERIVEARARAAWILRDTGWRRTAQISGKWLRQGPHVPPAAVRRPLDTALARGTLTLRSYDRVMRLAWSCAILAGRERLALDDIGRALFLKKGIRS